MIKANISQQETVALTQRLTAATLGILLGAFILMGVGFANADLLHNATHDARHANSFPCH